MTFTSMYVCNIPAELLIMPRNAESHIRAKLLVHFTEKIQPSTLSGNIPSNWGFTSLMAMKFQLPQKYHNKEQKDFITFLYIILMVFFFFFFSFFSGRGKFFMSAKSGKPRCTKFYKNQSSLHLGLTTDYRQKMTILSHSTANDSRVPAKVI